MAKLGYKNIQVYAEGNPGWVKAGYPLNKVLPRPDIPSLAPSQLQDKLESAYLLDYRSEKAYKEGHIKESRNIPLHQLSRRFQEIPADKRIITIDSRGRADWMPAAWFLKNKRYNNLMILKGGIEVWQKEGLPLEK